MVTHWTYVYKEGFGWRRERAHTVYPPILPRSHRLMALRAIPDPPDPAEKARSIAMVATVVLVGAVLVSHCYPEKEFQNWLEWSRTVEGDDLQKLAIARAHHMPFYRRDRFPK